MGGAWALLWATTTTTALMTFMLLVSDKPPFEEQW
jgi:hypothetical protein